MWGGGGGWGGARAPPGGGGGGSCRFTLYSTVHREDPTGVVLGAASLLEDTFAGIVGKAPGLVTVTVTDHLGTRVSPPDVGCALSSAVNVLRGTVTFSPYQEVWCGVGWCMWVVGWWWWWWGGGGCGAIAGAGAGLHAGLVFECVSWVVFGG